MHFNGPSKALSMLYGEIIDHNCKNIFIRLFHVWDCSLVEFDTYGCVAFQREFNLNSCIGQVWLKVYS